MTLACIIAFDNISAPKLSNLVRAIKHNNNDAYIFFIEHTGNNLFSNGALFNICVQMAGFSPMDQLCFFSFMWNRWNVSHRVYVKDFLYSNGYNNHTVSASALDVHRTNKCGYKEVFASDCSEIRHSERCYHYVVQVDEDKILPVDFIEHYDIAL